MKHLSALAFGLFTALSVPAWAQSPVVVELFTSQGCSSCPPADKLMHELAKRDDVIALALHVDYWDYIGWKDEFADPNYSKRQRGYAVEAGRRSVYTPQMIINGTTDIVGARPMELSKAIADHSAMASPVTLSVVRSGDDVAITATAQDVAGPLIVHMVRYQEERTAKITRGENAGHTLAYANVTEDWKILQEWDGATDLSLTAQATGDKPVVVLIQQGVHGRIVAAAQIR
ncbi:thioredoxin family protein [uncultured Tateyamaria sp.]|uniref:DUF1223 domain-containing protein n=1 Tax=uncultured Tateyamaria sp. TaxID=455651 RepID=UPI0026257431|nr:DUF1223 domain-containing protein [uncultured Tateyamaria sp.]